MTRPDAIPRRLVEQEWFSASPSPETPVVFYGRLLADFSLSPPARYLIARWNGRLPRRTKKALVASALGRVRPGSRFARRALRAWIRADWPQAVA